MATAAQLKEFLEIVDSSLASAKRAAFAYGRQHRLLAIGGVVSGGIATALTGGVAAGGANLADAVGGWRLVCFAAALAAATAAVLAGVQERLRTPEHAANASACAAELTALRFSLRTGAMDAEEYHKEYKALLQKYSKYMTSAS